MMLSLMLFFNAQRYHMCQFLSVCGLTIQEFYPNIVFLFDVRHLYVVCGLSIIRRNQKISSLSFLKHSACFVSIYVFLELSLCKIVISSFFGLARHSIWGSEEAATSGKLSRKENRWKLLKNSPFHLAFHLATSLLRCHQKLSLKHNF